LQTLTESRAQVILDKLSAGGVEQSRIETKGLGGSVPLVPNTTNVNRTKNRRIDLILVPAGTR
jgi:outer membrane protein OmpA-like peptidoglycan-associated protein